MLLASMLAAAATTSAGSEVPSITPAMTNEPSKLLGKAGEVVISVVLNTSEDCGSIFRNACSIARPCCADEGEIYIDDRCLDVLDADTADLTAGVILNMRDEESACSYLTGVEKLEQDDAVWVAADCGGFIDGRHQSLS